jgi:hypothetical protein
LKTNIFILILLGAVGFASAQKTLRYEDYVYEPNIKSVQLYPQASSAYSISSSALNPAVARLGETMTLEFDDLTADYEQFHVKIFHCTADWKQSVLSEIEYLNEYNDYIINDYEVSRNTKVSYYHYKIEIPAVKISGNYVLVVHRERNKTDYILSKRFIVYEQKIGASMNVRTAQDPNLWKTHQQVDFEIAYGGYRMMSPRDELKLVVRQNYRWDRAIYGLKPFTVDESSGRLKYSFFRNENVFPAGNEFRFFDSRNTYSRGLGIDKIQRGKEDDMWVSHQSNRSEYTYTESFDFDGLYAIDNMETHRGETEADYIWMTFGLKSHEIDTDKQVYVNGAFNNWQLDKENLMEYDDKYGGYVATVRLKQGVYNYNFVTKDAANRVDETFFEGNFSDTQNTYEIIIYHRPITARAERVVGYAILNFNKRR